MIGTPLSHEIKLTTVEVALQRFALFCVLDLVFGEETLVLLKVGFFEGDETIEGGTVEQIADFLLLLWLIRADYIVLAIFHLLCRVCSAEWTLLMMLRLSLRSAFH